MKVKVLIYFMVFTLVGWISPQAYSGQANFGAEQLQVDLDTPFEQELSEYKPNTTKTPKLSKPVQASSVSFLMGDNALSAPSVSPKPIPVPTKQDLDKIDFDNFTIKPVPRKKAPRLFFSKVTQAVSNDCSEQNGRNGHIVSCTKHYSDGSYTETIDQRFKFPGEHKRQVIITDYDKNGERESRKSIRYRETYTMEGVLTAEHIDVVTRPYTGKILREFLIRHVDPTTKETTKLMWTKYRQIGNEMMAEISHHAVLNFDSQGRARNGRAEKWDGNKVVDTLLNVDTVKFPAMRVQQTNWNQWENRIHNMIQQVRVL